MNNCNFTTCRYNADGKCANDEKKKECIDVCEKVLCIDKKTFRKIDNVKHIGDADGKPIETSEFHDMTMTLIFQLMQSMSTQNQFQADTRKIIMNFQEHQQ